MLEPTILKPNFNERNKRVQVIVTVRGYYRYRNPSAEKRKCQTKNNQPRFVQEEQSKLSF